MRESEFALTWSQAVGLLSLRGSLAALPDEKRFRAYPNGEIVEIEKSLPLRGTPEFDALIEKLKVSDSLRLFIPSYSFPFYLICPFRYFSDSLGASLAWGHFNRSAVFALLYLRRAREGTRGYLQGAGIPLHRLVFCVCL